MSLSKHPEYQAFVAAVIAAPDDDLPRLQFADWLDEHNDPRGEFIKVQIELEKYQDERRSLERLANLPWQSGIPYDLQSLKFRGQSITDRMYRRLQETDKLMAQEHDAFDRCLSKRAYPADQTDLFTRPVRNILPAGTFLPPLISWFRRGFIHNIQTTYNDWIANAEAILSQNPLKEVTLTTYPEIVFQEWLDHERMMQVIEAHIRHTDCYATQFITQRDLIDQRAVDILAFTREQLTQELRRHILSQWPNLKIKYDVPDRTWVDSWGNRRNPVRPDATGHLLPAQRVPDGTLPSFEYHDEIVSDNDQWLADTLDRLGGAQQIADAMRSPMMQFDNLPPIPNPHFETIDNQDRAETNPHSSDDPD